MTTEPQLFRIALNETQDSKIIASDGKVEEVDFAHLGLEEKHIEKWIESDPDIIQERLLIIGRQYSGFDKISEKPDLLAVDQEGNLVVIELKRDDSGSDTHWQAIKYASYLCNAKLEDILSEYKGIDQSDAKEEILGHIDSDDLNGLNSSQRIILVSHRFAPQVTSAALWLNEKAQIENLITCIRLIPYRDEVDGSLHMQAYSIIPSADVEVIKPGSKQGGNGNGSKDEVTNFCEKVVGLVRDGISDPTIRPSRWNSKAGGTDDRWYRLWYSRSPWQNKRMRYRIILSPDDDSKWRTNVGLDYNKPLLKRRWDYSEEDFDNLHGMIQNLDVTDGQGGITSDGVWGWRTVELDESSSLDDDFAERIAKVFKQVIETVTPEIDKFEEERAAKKVT